MQALFACVRDRLLTWGIPLNDKGKTMARRHSALNVSSKKEKSAFGRAAEMKLPPPTGCLDWHLAVRERFENMGRMDERIGFR